MEMSYRVNEADTIVTLVQTSIVPYHPKLRPLLNPLVHPRLNNLMILNELSENPPLEPASRYLSRVCRPPDRFSDTYITFKDKGSVVYLLSII